VPLIATGHQRRSQERRGGVLQKVTRKNCVIVSRKGDSKLERRRVCYITAVEVTVFNGLPKASIDPDVLGLLLFNRGEASMLINGERQEDR
jgi:hypothetical protein